MVEIVVSFPHCDECCQKVVTRCLFVVIRSASKIMSNRIDAKSTLRNKGFSKDHKQLESELCGHDEQLSVEGILQNKSHQPNHSRRYRG
jgi:hypothetical protein